MLLHRRASAVGRKDRAHTIGHRFAVSLYEREGVSKQAGRRIRGLLSPSRSRSMTYLAAFCSSLLALRSASRPARCTHSSLGSLEQLECSNVSVKPSDARILSGSSAVYVNNEVRELMFFDELRPDWCREYLVLSVAPLWPADLVVRVGRHDAPVLPR